MKTHLNPLHYQPSTLTKAEIEDPSLVLTSFFDSHTLQQARQNIWEFYKGWVNYVSDFSDGELNANMLFFYSQLVDLVDASYLSMQRSKENLTKEIDVLEK